MKYGKVIPNESNTETEEDQTEGRWEEHAKNMQMQTETNMLLSCWVSRVLLTAC